MSWKNTQLNLENSVARFKGEREAKLKEIEIIIAGMESVAALRSRVAELDNLVAAAELILRDNNPDWSAANIKPRRPTNQHSPIPYGELGPTGLDVLREAYPAWVLTRDAAQEILCRFALDPTDRLLLDKTTGSLGQYLKKHAGDLVESDGQRLYKRWRVIRKSCDCTA